MGAILAPPIVAYLILRIGWQAAFAFVGLAGLLVAGVLVQHVSHAEGAARRARGTVVPVRELLRTRFVWAFTFSKIFMDPVWYFYIFWFPEYLKHARGFDLAKIGIYGWIPFMVAGFGNILGGWMSGRLLKRGWSVTMARKTSVTFFAALMTSAIPAVLAPEAWMSIALVSIAMLGYTGCLANMLSFPADVFPKTAVGSVYGLASMGSGFGGMLFTLITGWVVEHYSYTPVFFGFGILPLICATILWTLLGPLHPGRHSGVERGVRDGRLRSSHAGCGRLMPAALSF